MYVEMDLPSNESSLSESLEDYFCTSNLSAWPCNNCNNICQSEKRTQIGLVTETEFLTMILTRTIQTEGGFELNKKEIICTNDVYIRYNIIT